MPFSARLKAALPGWRIALAGSALWSAALAASAASWLMLSDRFATSRWQVILAIFAAGGALAFAPGLFVARLIVPSARPEPRFAAAFLCMGVASVLGVAFVYSMQYRTYYAEWHEPFPAIAWFFQLAFTGAAALYQFVVLGMRMFFPLALAALFVFALWHARQTR